jgi:hypothetical protein
MRSSRRRPLNLPVGGHRFSPWVATVWVRADGEQLVVVHVDERQGPREVARHLLTTPGRPRIDDAHYPPRPAGALLRRPRARGREEREFLQISEGAERWLTHAAAEGTQRIRRKMAEAVDLATLLSSHADGPRSVTGDTAKSRSDLAGSTATNRVSPLPTESQTDRPDDNTDRERSFSLSDEAGAGVLPVWRGVVAAIA